MTPAEAIVEAANTSQLKWLRSRLDQHDSKVRNEAMIAAASDGYITAVRVLTLEVIGATTEKLDPACRQVPTDAAAAAARNGHLIVVELLLLEIVADKSAEFLEEDESGSGSVPTHDAAWNRKSIRWWAS